MPQYTVTYLPNQDVVGRKLFKMNGAHCLTLANVIITRRKISWPAQQLIASQ